MREAPWCASPAYPSRMLRNAITKSQVRSVTIGQGGSRAAGCCCCCDGDGYGDGAATGEGLFEGDGGPW